MRKTTRFLAATGLTVLLFSVVFSLATVANAQFSNPGGGQPGPTNPSTSDTFQFKIRNPIGIGDTIPEIIRKVIENVILPIGGTIAVIMIIYGGFLFVVARGNEEKLKDAKKTLTRAVIGAAILLGAWAIAAAIENTVRQLTQ